MSQTQQKGGEVTASCPSPATVTQRELDLIKATLVLATYKVSACQLWAPRDYIARLVATIDPQEVYAYLGEL